MIKNIAFVVVFVASLFVVSPAFAGSDDNPCCALAQRPRVVSTPKPSSPRVTKIYMNGVDRYARSENKRQDAEIAKKANSEDVAKKFAEVDDRLAGHDTSISNLEKGLAAVKSSIDSALADLGWMKMALAIVGLLALAAFVIALIALFRNRAAATATASATTNPAACAPAPAPAGTAPVMNWDPTQLRVTAVEVVPPANQQPQQVSRPAFQQPANRGRRASVVPSHDDDSV